MFQSTLPIILASGSSIRKKMLDNVGINVIVIPPDGFDEDALKATLAHLPPAPKALELAKGKAQFVSVQHPHALVIAADQICALNNVIYSKPVTTLRAYEQLRALSGHTHQQYSAVCLYINGINVWEHVATAHLTMRQLTDEEICGYIELDTPLSSCGSYLFEQHGKHLFSHVEGTDDVIQGLPLIALLNILHSHRYINF